MKVLTFLGVCIATFLLGVSVSNAIELPHIDPTKVRYGDVSKFDSDTHQIGVVNSQSVYLKIPEYKKLKKEGYKKGSAQYYELMAKATKKYAESLKRASSLKNCYIIVENGGVEGYTTIEVTQTCIKYFTD
jgi:hypothetical protein